MDLEHKFGRIKQNIKECLKMIKQMGREFYGI